MALARRNAQREADMADNFIAGGGKERFFETQTDANAFNVALAGFDDGAVRSGPGINQDRSLKADALIATGKLDGSRREVRKMLNAAIDLSQKKKRSVRTLAFQNITGKWKGLLPLGRNRRARPRWAQCQACTARPVVAMTGMYLDASRPILVGTTPAPGRGWRQIKAGIAGGGHIRPGGGRVLLARIARSMT